MDFDITLKNYRCFQQPARIAIRKGLTSFVGVNNAGKSSLLRFFYEARNIFRYLKEKQNLEAALKGAIIGYSPLGTHDPQEVFCNYNDKDIEIEINFIPTEQCVYRPVRKLLLAIRRDSMQGSARLTLADGSSPQLQSVTTAPDGTTITPGGSHTHTIKGLTPAHYVLLAVGLGCEAGESPKILFDDAGDGSRNERRIRPQPARLTP